MELAFNMRPRNLSGTIKDEQFKNICKAQYQVHQHHSHNKDTKKPANKLPGRQCRRGVTKEHQALTKLKYLLVHLNLQQKTGSHIDTNKAVCCQRNRNEKSLLKIAQHDGFIHHELCLLCYSLRQLLLMLQNRKQQYKIQNLTILCILVS